MWPEGVYSVVKFELEKRNPGTRLILDHAGFAAEHREHLNAGWSRMYWEPLKKYLGSADSTSGPKACKAGCAGCRLAAGA